MIETNLFPQAIQYHQAGQFDVARRLYEQILQSEPTHFDALHMMGVLCYQTKNYLNAAQYIQKALNINANHPEVFNHFGLALVALGKYKEAEEIYLRAQQLAPNFTPGLHNLAILYAKLCRWEEAQTIYTQILALIPEYAEIFNLRAGTYMSSRQLDKALLDFDKALALDPQNIEYLINKSLLLRLTGDYLGGFMAYESRWQRPHSKLHIYPDKTYWYGQAPLTGKIIFVQTEQGYGDVIQLARYIPLLVQEAKQVIVQVPQSLKSLLAPVADCIWISHSEPIPHFDLYCSFFSLPVAYKTTPTHIPFPTTYLTADARLCQKWREKLKRLNGPLIGLAWRGNPDNISDYSRSIPLATLIAKLPSEFQYISLHKDLSDDDRITTKLYPHLHEFASELTDFNETAALCANLDLIISVDTVIAHLAGAIGKEVWLMLAFDSDWRWGITGTKTAWYPSCTLFRQTKPLDWSSVIQEAGKTLVQGTQKLAQRVHRIGLVSYLDLAKEAYQQNQLEACEQFLNSFLKYQPKEFDSRLLKGYMYVQKQQFDLAKLEFQEAVKINSKSFDAWYNLGMSQCMTQAFREGTRAFAHAIALQPKKAEAYYHCAMAYAELNEYHIAIAFIGEGIKLEPMQAKNYYSRASYYFQLEKYPEAEAD
ncbi:MAG: tetratricopeptide repeat protein, partial [Gammaproteobacteria bacterium]|nr:tetratricopeptide repeat protein [Gammaproteobacteria bacterium]